MEFMISCLSLHGVHEELTAKVSFAYLRIIKSTHAYANSIVVSVLSYCLVEEILATCYIKFSGDTIVTLLQQHCIVVCNNYVQFTDRYLYHVACLLSCLPQLPKDDAIVV